MAIKDELIRLTAALRNANIPHALIGGLAVGFSGVARFTNDIDLLIDDADRERAVRELGTLGYRVWKEGSEFIQMEGPVPLDLMMAKRLLSRMMITNAQAAAGSGIPCVSVEDLIGLKIQSFATNRKREHRDKADIQALAEANRIDRVKIKLYADLFDVWDEVLPLLETND